MPFCLPEKAIEKFKKRLTSGKIQPEKLIEMTSKQRRSFFSEFLGEVNGKEVNILFESKLLLKSQKRGIVNWAKQVVGMKPQVRRDILARVERMTEALEPKEMDKFLEDIVERRLGMKVSLEEAGKISELAKDVAEARAALEKGGDRLDYGNARVEFQNVVNEIKIESQKKTPLEKIKDPVGGFIEVAGASKSLKSSLDVSALLRQGLKTLWTNPRQWWNNVGEVIPKVFREFGTGKAADAINADIVSRPNSVNGRYKKANLSVGAIEEAFPSILPERVPGVGRAFKASNEAFTLFMHRVRADVFDKYIEIAKSTGVELTIPELKAIGKLVNSQTGRGHLGRLEPVADIANVTFFSLRLAKSHIDTLSAHSFQKGVSPFVRKQAAISLTKIVAGTATIMAISNALAPGSAEIDPRSANFGKIKVGNTRFDITGGMASFVTLASRLLTQSTKSSVTDTTTPLGEGGFGSRSGGDVLIDFTGNKLSPMFGVIKDLITQETFEGEKPTFLYEAGQLFAPLPIVNAIEVQEDPDSAPLLVAMIADSLGIGTNTYSAAQDWSANPGVTMQQFLDKVGEKAFNEANDKFNTRLNDWLKKRLKDPAFQKLDNETRKKVISSKKTELKNAIFKEYKFKYRPEKKQKLPKFDD